MEKRQTKRAVECFFIVRDFEGLLSCKLTGLLGEQFDGMSYAELAETVLTDCPVPVQEQHPLSVLRLCVLLFSSAQFDEFERNMARVRLMIQKSGDQQMMGEWRMVSALLAFPDIPAMKGCYLRAESMLDGVCRVFDKRDPFMFGTTSMWYLFYTKPGKMIETAADLKELMEVYNRVTGGRGTGVYELYLGEALSVQGKFDESDILAHKAAFLSETYQNASITYGAALLLGINAIYRSDMSALQKAVDHLENKALAYPFLQGTAINQTMTGDRARLFTWTADGTKSVSKVGQGGCGFHA